VLILGLAFKENCPDMRNTRVVDVVAELCDYGVHVDVHDPWVDAADVQKEYGIALTSTPEPEAYDGVILAVTHDSYREAGAAALRRYGRPGHVFYDLKSVFARDESDLRL
jgi:UDP-N-acetyl-D-galactosamine dehydrogenase